MSFDKGAFRAMAKEVFALAANPNFVPQPDLDLEDEAMRDAKHKAAIKHAATSREVAIADACAHSAMRFVAERLPEMWKPGMTDKDFDLDAVMSEATDAIKEGSGEKIGEAAILLFMVGFAKLIKE